MPESGPGAAKGQSSLYSQLVSRFGKAKSCDRLGSPWSFCPLWNEPSPHRRARARGVQMLGKLGNGRKLALVNVSVKGIAVLTLSPLLDGPAARGRQDTGAPRVTETMTMARISCAE